MNHPDNDFNAYMSNYYATNTREFVKMGAAERDVSLAAAHVWMVQEAACVYGITSTTSRKGAS